VGRFAGLGYCQFLTFRTKAQNDNLLTEVRWDCRKMKAILNDHSYAGELGRVVSEIVSVKVLSAPISDHFFEVHMEKVIRIRGDILLNESAVRSYIGQIAPLPFHEDFGFGSAIDSHLRERIPAPRFDVLINEDTTPLARPFRDVLAVTRDKTAAVDGFQIVSIEDHDGSIRALGWVLEHSYSGALHGSPAVRGLRARVGDIQVGGDDILTVIFPEERFNAWTVGEIHVLDRRIRPNGRRDDFEHNPAYFSLVSELTPLGRSIAKKCRVSSARRNRLKKFESDETCVRDALRILAQGSVSKATAKKLKRDAAGRLAQMEKLVGGSLIVEQDRENLAARVNKLRSRLEKLADVEDRADPLAGIPPKRRAIYEEMIDLIYECSSNRSAAKVLVDRVTARLAAR
jgi:hypothetical protein